MRLKFSQWYSDELTKLFVKDSDQPVDLFMPQMKHVNGQWLVQLYEHLEDNRQIIVHNFRHTGIYDALGLLDEDDLPDYTTTDKPNMDKIMESASSKHLVSDVYTNSQTEEEIKTEDTGIDDVIISDFDSHL